MAPLLTGGTGGLGLLTARWLAQRGARALVLASRSGALAACGGEWARCGRAARVRVERCDAAEPSHGSLVAGCAQARRRCAGVWHAAGVLADALLPRRRGIAARVFAPKAHGAWALHAACAALPLHACALFSSVAALLGGAGQANYARPTRASTRWQRAGARAACGDERAVGPVGGGGDGGGRRHQCALERQGWGRVGLAQGLAALRAAWARRAGTVVSVMPMSWERVLGGVAAVPAFLAAFAPRQWQRMRYAAAAVAAPRSER